MTVKNGGGPIQKKLGLSAGRLGLSASASLETPSSRFQPPAARNSSSVIVVTKNKSSMKNVAEGAALSKEEQLRRLSLLKMAEETRSQKAKQTLKEQSEVESADAQQLVEIVTAENRAIVEEHQSITQGLNEEPASAILENSALEIAFVEEKEEPRRFIETYIARSRVRNLDSISAPISKIIENEDIAPIALSDVPSQKRNVLASAEPKKSLADRKREKDAEERPIVKKAAFVSAPELSRLKRQTNKGSLSRFAISLNDEDDDSSYMKRKPSSIKKARNKRNKYTQQQQEKVFREVLIPDIITIQELSNRMTEKAVDVIKALMKMGTLVTVNQSIDADTAELIVLDFGHKPKRITDAEFEKGVLLDAEFEDHGQQEPRAPVVTVMGHVDHGKTSLLDALRSTDVTLKEAGGITQHIGAYNVKLGSGKHITFLDTPGHEAFTAMRMRGAQVTDIVVLVVAADDGIKEQTVEAINHAKAAGVSIIVAINKIDKPDADPSRVKNELLSHGLVPEEMGGDVIVTQVSARTKQGLDKLEEAILLQAEMMSLQANPNAAARGAVIEASVDRSKGSIATLLVQQGTLKAGCIIVAGSCYGKVKALLDDKGLSITSAGPSIPVVVLGLNQSPTAGETFLVAKNEAAAREIVEFRIQKAKEKKSSIVTHKSSMEAMFSKASKTGSKNFAVIVKADVNGSVEAIVMSLAKITHEELSLQVLHSGVGGITESDVALAAASNAIIVGFNVRANSQARDAAKQANVEIKYYSVIYDLLDDVKASLTGLLSPVIREEFLGYAEVRQLFDLTKFGKVAGCIVTEGLIQRNSSVRLLRDSIVMYTGKLKALKRFKDDVKEVKAGFECGISFEKYDDIRVGDRLEAFALVEEARQL